ncbi:putative ribonuclease H-like domain-containing protein [Tanacetum coccineum]|uniref:Ribonuclease H-like domain-containing protein n=1 Tax=Tanacetum coccineum TaxID=301880 RepID=A0ABQ5IW70_9ASTR
MGQNGLFCSVRLEMGARGFKALFLLLNSDLGTLISPFDHYLEAIVEIESRMDVGFGINKWYQSFALRNFDLEDMELESINSDPTAKLPILKLGEFGGNAATKKTQKTLLKQQYENFSATSAESLDSIFNRLQKIVSRLAILGVMITQEDLTLKFLSSLPPEWNTHVVVWINKPEIETMSIDDLYNNFKIVEQKIKKTVGTSIGGQNLAFMSAPSSSNTNNANTASSQVSAASSSVNTVSSQVCTASVSDNIVYAFMVENPNGSNVLHQDLEQIHEDDLEAMDLKWQLSLLSVRAKKYYQKTNKKIFINGNDIAGYDKSKVECYNCHKLGHFARECRAPRSKEGQFKNQDNTKKQGTNEDTSKAMLAIDGVGFDWSDMAEEQVQTNMALMAFSDSEAQLVTYKKNEVLFSEEVVVLKREVGIKQYEINTLKTEFEKLKQEKDAIDFKIEKFDKALKDLYQLLGSHITDNSKKGFGYSAVPLPYHLIYNRPNKLDLSYSGLEEFKEPEFRDYSPENSKKESNVTCENESDNSKENSDKSLVEEQVLQVKSSFVEGCESNTSKSVNEVEPKKVRKNNDAPIIEDWVSDDEEEDEPKPKSEKKIVIPTAAKKESVKPEKLVKKSVRYAEMYRSQFPRGNQRNWNRQKSNQLGKDFVMYKKACFKCGSFNHLQYNCHNHQRRDITNRNNYNRVHAKNTHPNVLRNMSPKAVLLNTGLAPLNTAKSVYTAHPKQTVHCARPKTHFYKSAQSTVQRLFYKKPALTNRHFNHKVNTVRPRVVNTARSYRSPVNTIRPRVVNTARPNRTSVNAARANGFNAGNPQHDDTGFVDSGCSRHMTGNIAYLSDFKQFVGGYVAFGGDAYGGKITGKGTLKTDKLDFEDVYFVNELKFNLILLKIPRKDNMYNFDMKNIILKESLTCFIAKATLDESMLWHRRLGHINFKNIKRVNTFVAIGSKVQESKEKKEEGREEIATSSRKKMLRRKRVGKEQKKESSKKQKVEEEKESEEVDEINEVEFKKLMSSGKSKRYSSMIRMLQGIDREDLEALWRIVKAKYGDTRPEDEFKRVLYRDLKVMFEPDTTSEVWRMLQGYRWINIKFRGGLLGLKRLHGFLEVTAARVHNGNYAKCAAGGKIACLKTFYCQEDKDELKR